jgi:hypothetical protein
MKKQFFNSLLFLILLSSCSNHEDTKGQYAVKETDDVKWAEPSTIKQGPILNESLSKDQLEKIDFMFETFKEVDPTPKEKWIEDFKRDINPNREIEIWMMMANAYNSFCKEKSLTTETKKEVYQVVLLRSGASEEEALKHMNAKYLSEADIKEIMKAYTLEAKPIRVMEK